MPPEPAQTQQPGLIAGICSIVAGAVGFGVPILGMLASCVAIGLGIAAIRQGRRAKHRSSVVCGVVGTVLGPLGIVYWVCVILFESYR